MMRLAKLALPTELRRAADEKAGDADALVLYTVERTADCIADSEPKSLRVSTEGLGGLLVDLVRARPGLQWGER